MSITQEKMSAAQEASGMKTSNFTANMSTYYFAIAVFVGGLIDPKTPKPLYNEKK